MTPDRMAPDNHWQRGDGIRYGLLGLPLAFCALPLYVLMPNLYAREWGVPLAALGSVLLGMRLLDAVIDPLLGNWIDRLFEKSLQTVLYMGAGSAALLGLGFCALFLPAVNQPAALLWWAGACLLLTYTAFSALSIAHQAWGTRLGGDALFRSRLVASREGMGLLGVMLASVTPSLLGRPTMLAILVTGLCVGWLTWVQAPRPAVLPAPLRLKTSGSGEGELWLPWKNSAFRRLLVVYALNGIASAIPATLVLFFLQDRLQASAVMQSVALAIYFTCGAASMPGWLYLVPRLGLARTWRVGMALAISVFIAASGLSTGDAAWFLLVCALSGAALGSDLTVPGALLAGVIGAAADRGRSAGAFLGWWNFATKLNVALAAGVVLPLLAWLGYEPGSRDIAALSMLTTTYCVLPCLLKIAAGCALQRLIIQSTDHPTCHEPSRL